MPHSKCLYNHPAIAAMQGFDRKEDLCFIISKDILEHANFLLSEYEMDFDIMYVLKQDKDIKKFFDNCFFFGYKEQCENNLVNFKDCIIYGR